MDTTRALLCPLFFSFVSLSASESQSQQSLRPPEVIHIDNASLDRLEQWLDAIATHMPGAPDDAIERAQSWSTGELRTLWINATALLSLMHEPGWKKLFVTVSGLRQR